MAEDRFVEPGIAAVNRLEDRKRRQAVRRALRVRGLPARRRNRREQIVRGSGESGNSQQDHIDTKVTPHTTSVAPAQRNPFTRSLSTYFASTVSITYVTAETRTA